nr:hypothetical protein Iba_chr15aCG11830 [Ipomoea batatas]
MEGVETNSEGEGNNPGSKPSYKEKCLDANGHHYSCFRFKAIPATTAATATAAAVADASNSTASPSTRPQNPSDLILADRSRAIAAVAHYWRAGPFAKRQP